MRRIMADHVPFITGDEGAALVKAKYADSEIIRVPLQRAEELLSHRPPSAKIWLDASLDGMDDMETRQHQPGRKNKWLEYMSKFPNFEKIGDPRNHMTLTPTEVYPFVKAVLGRCAMYKPAWITVPQIPLVEDSTRNKINRALASATGKWKSATGYSGRLILSLVFTHQGQINLKTARNAKVQQAERCYHDAQADGFWAVDKSLTDDNGSATLRDKRFPGVIGLHEELNERI